MNNYDDQIVVQGQSVPVSFKNHDQSQLAELIVNGATAKEIILYLLTHSLTAPVRAVLITVSSVTVDIFATTESTITEVRRIQIQAEIQRASITFHAFADEIVKIEKSSYPDELKQDYILDLKRRMRVRLNQQFFQ